MVEDDIMIMDCEEMLSSLVLDTYPSKVPT